MMTWVYGLYMAGSLAFFVGTLLSAGRTWGWW